MRFFCCFIIILLSFPSMANDHEYASKNIEKESFFLAMKTMAEDKVRDYVQDAINDFFEEPMYEIIGRGIGEAFGESFAKNFSGLISIGPFLSMDSLIGSFGASESQVMTRVLLKAIEQAKEEIIAAVEENYRVETRARIDALIDGMEIYNARSELDRRQDYTRLGDYIDDANYILSRIEAKPNDYVEGVHPYMSVAGLRVMMQMEYTKWLRLDHDEDATDIEIDLEVNNVLAVQVSQVNSFVTQSIIGQMQFWRNEFYNEFSSKSRYVRQITAPDIAGLDNGSDYFLEGSGIYAYMMNGKDVEFFIARRKDYCVREDNDGRQEITRKYDVFDVSGEVVRSFLWTHSSRQNPIGYNEDYLSHCSYTAAQLALLVDKGIYSSFIGYSIPVSEPINAHKNDQAAFDLYLVDGYLPMKQLLDSWWNVKGSVPRPKSEVDLYVESQLGGRAEISLEKVEAIELGENAEGQDQYRYIYEVSNIGFADASVEFSVADGWPFGGNTVVEGFIVDSVIVPIANCTSSKVCDIGTIEVDEGIQVAVLVTPSSYDTAYFTVRADSDVPQLTPRGKSISDRVEIEEEPCSSWFCL